MTKSSEDEAVEVMAAAIWESQTGGIWEARMSWYKAKPEVRAARIAKGAHPDNFDDNSDIDAAFKAARAALTAYLKLCAGTLKAPKEKSKILVAAEEILGFIKGEADTEMTVYIPDRQGGLVKHKVSSIAEYNRLLDGEGNTREEKRN